MSSAAATQQVATLDSGYFNQVSGATFSTAQTAQGESGGNDLEGFYRFPTWPSLVGKTITRAELRVVDSAGTNTGTPLLKVRAEDAAAPARIITAVDGRSRTVTTAGIDWDEAWIAQETIRVSPDIKTVIQELIDTWTVTVIQILILDDGSTPNTNMQSYTFDGAPTKGGILQLWF